MGAVAVLGPGRIGRQIALAFALGGLRVVLVDLKTRSVADSERVLADARAEIARDLRLMVEEGVVGDSDEAAALARIEDRVGLGDLGDCAFVQEALPESVELKRETFKRLAGRIAPDTVVASTSSTISPSHLADAVDRPERFLVVEGRDVLTRPIKGTRRRRADPKEDAAAAAELAASPKDRAENVMIVDLLRNDLGRVCETGSVRVQKLCELESFATVHHLVSTVTGRLAEGLDGLHALEACFPGGSITGAPKRRAMQVIDELEPHQRGIYGGAVGYVSYTGNIDLAIAIRTLVSRGDTIYVQAGAGLVADSVPELEYDETVNKARAVLRAVAMARTAEETRS